METFYKATRIDGFDFYSVTVDYAGHLESGEMLPLKDGNSRECCTDGVYHASTSAADTLIGGSWPCRLFEVTGNPVAQEENKRGFLTLRVIRELPSWMALGPNGESVSKFIEDCRAISRSPAGRNGAAWYAAGYAAWNAAWYAARDAARDAAGYAARDAAWYAARDAAGYAAWNAARDAARDAAWNAARYAARDAASGLVVRDLITSEQFSILTLAWVSVMGVI